MLEWMLHPFVHVVDDVKACALASRQTSSDAASSFAGRSFVSPSMNSREAVGEGIRLMNGEYFKKPSGLEVLSILEDDSLNSWSRGNKRSQSAERIKKFWYILLIDCTVRLEPGSSR